MSLLRLLHYSIDTSAILDSWVRWHPPDSFPSLWNNIEKMINDGTLGSTEEVREELSKQDDNVYKWAKDRDNLFIPLTPNIQTAASEILSRFQKLVGALSDRSQADVFVIALAMVENCTVITGEFSDSIFSILSTFQTRSKWMEMIEILKGRLRWKMVKDIHCLR